MRALPHTTPRLPIPYDILNKINKLSSSPPLLDSNTVLCKTEQDMCETQTFRFSLMFQPHCCSAVSSCQSSRVTCRLLLPHFSEMPGSAAGFYPVICLRRGLVFTALLLITELGERATPTHWLIGSFAQHAGTLLVKMWRTDAYSVVFRSADSLPHSAHL